MFVGNSNLHLSDLHCGRQTGPIIQKMSNDVLQKYLCAHKQARYTARLMKMYLECINFNTVLPFFCRHTGLGSES